MARDWIARVLMTKAEVLRPEAGLEPGGARDCGSVVRRVWSLLEHSVILEQVPEERLLLGVAEPPGCARLGLHQARLAVAAVGPLSSPGNRLGYPPWHPLRPTSRYHCSPSSWRARPEGRRGAGDGEEGGSGRAPGAGRRRAAPMPRRWWESPVFSPCFRGLPNPLALGDS